MINRLRSLIPPELQTASIAVFFMALIDELHIAMLDLMEQFIDKHPDLFD